MTAKAGPVPCQGKMFVDSVFQVSTGGTKFEYSFQIRNGTAVPLKWTVKLGGFPTTVTLFSPVLRGGTIAAHTAQTIRFGTGTNDNITMGTVQVLYDRTGSGRPSVAVTNCIS